MGRWDDGKWSVGNAHRDAPGSPTWLTVFCSNVPSLTLMWVINTCSHFFISLVPFCRTKLWLELSLFLCFAIWQNSTPYFRPNSNASSFAKLCPGTPGIINHIPLPFSPLFILLQWQRSHFNVPGFIYASLCYPIGFWGWGQFSRVLLDILALKFCLYMAGGQDVSGNWWCGQDSGPETPGCHLVLGNLW